MSILFAWGSNASGALGLGHFSDVCFPSRVTLSATKVSSAESAHNDRAKSSIRSKVFTGGCHSVLLNDSNDVFSCGDNVDGALGDPDLRGARRSSFELVPGLIGKKIEKVACGWNFTFAVATGGTEVYAWGSNKHGQLGIAASESSPRQNSKLLNPPSRVHIPGTAQVRVKKIACGWKHTLVLFDNGTVYTSGSNSHGQLGRDRDERPKCEFAPTKTPVGVQFSTVVCGWIHSAGLGHLESGAWTIFGWGSNKHNQIGDSSVQEASTISPKSIVSSSDFGTARVIDVQSGWSHMLALTDEGNVFSWGRNDYGQCGRSSDGKTALFVQKVLPLNDVVQIACGSEHSAAVTRSNEVYMWGWNEHGNLGHLHGERKESLVSKPEPFARIPIKLRFPQNFSCVRTEGTVTGCTTSYKPEKIVCAGALNFLSCQ